MKPSINHYSINTKGRDIAVGDIHGCFSKLMKSLEAINFDFDSDRLFSVGDLVDRGEESNQAIDWIYYHWFHACKGNHDQMAIDFARGTGWPMSLLDYSYNGGSWNIANSLEERETVALCFEDLPLGIEVETSNGLVGLIHAECPFNDWNKFKETEQDFSVDNAAMWERSRYYNMDRSLVQGAKSLVVGHTPMNEPLVLGNVWYIDTMGWRPNGKFTLIDLSTMEPIPYTL